MFENILLEIDGAIATLTINRPDKRNAVNNDTVEEIGKALDQIEADPGLRVLILTGAGEKAFVAGADIGELDRRDTLLGRSETRRRQEVYTRIEQLEIPSIAAVNGWALGTGLELAMVCTLRIASAKAKMGQPEVKLGIIPGAGGTYRLPRLVGMGRALEMILTGEPVTAEEALAMGLVNRVVPPENLMEEVRTLAETIVSRPKLAVQYAKEAVLRCVETGLAQGLAHESYLHALSCGTQDKKEGVASFLEKRTAKFTGK
ncbi:MAG: enoyl-CoA hydratase/isomerase family protein [Candidatus Aminicenantes bacterium]|nr:enoyl-CoA hydratase/isomerase family protein [Candidatus Aminicenantes bacterium]